MFKFKIESIESVSDELLETLRNLEQQIFSEPYTREKIARELRTKTDVVSLVAYSQGKPCGFKVGYALDSETFFSWIGGVVDAARRQGVARALMQEQHAIARELVV